MDYIIVNLTSVAMAAKKTITKHKNTVGLMLSTHPKIVDGSQNLIRTFISGKQESEILIDYINKKNINNIAIVYIDDAYGAGIADYINDKLNKIILKKAYKISNLNFEPLIQNLKEKNIETIVLIGYGFEYPKFFQVLKSLNYAPLILSNMSFSNKKGQEINEYTNKIVFDAPIFDLEQKRGETVNNFIINYLVRFQSTPDFNAAYGYDSIKLIDIIKEKNIANVKRKTIQIEGASGLLTIMSNGDSKTQLELIER